MVRLAFRETSEELQKKQRFLWLSVAIFTILLLICWISILRFNIKKEFNTIDFDQLSKQIKENLDKFDTEIKNRNKPQEINLNELESIASDIENKIRDDFDSSLWPDYDFAELGLAIRYPDNWKKISDAGKLLISDQASTSQELHGKISIALKSSNLTLDNWIKINPLPEYYQKEKTVFIFSSTTPTSYSWIKIPKDAESQISEKIYYIKIDSKIIEINAEYPKDNEYYQKIIEEIIKTIKLNTKK